MEEERRADSQSAAGCHPAPQRVLFFFLFACSLVAAPPQHAHRYHRLVIRNAMVVDGNGTPASVPNDIVIEKNLIAEVVAYVTIGVNTGAAVRPVGDVEIDAK